MNKKLFSPPFVLASIILVRLAVMIALHLHTYIVFDEPWNRDVAFKVIETGHFQREMKDSFVPISLVPVWIMLKLKPFFHVPDERHLLRIFPLVVNQALVPVSYALARLAGASLGVSFLFCLFISFEPNLLGHSVISTNVDAYSFLWFFILAVVAMKWFKNRKIGYLALFGLVLGLAQAVKLTSVFAVPVCFLWLVWALRQRPWGRLVKQVSIFLVAAWVGLNAGYVFNGVGTPFNQIRFRTETFKIVGAELGQVPCLVPVEYLRALDMCRESEAKPRNVYIRNQLFDKGVWYYFPYAILLKSPLALLITALMGWYWGFRRRKVHGSVTLPLALLIVYMTYFCFFFNDQLGIRYLFIVLGFFYLGLIWFPWRAWSVSLALLWFTLSNIYNWPNYIGYFNEIVYQKHHRWWHLGDSNLTWAQEYNDWPRFAARNALDETTSGPGMIVVNKPFWEGSITVAGVIWARERLAFLRDHFDPVDSFWGVQLKYFITSADILRIFPPKRRIGNPNNSKLSCTESGFVVDNVPGAYLGFHELPPGHHTAVGYLEVPTETPILIQMLLKGTALVKIDGQNALEAKDAALTGQTYVLEPGSHKVEIDMLTNLPPVSEVRFSIQALNATNPPPPHNIGMLICNPLVGGGR